MNAYNGEMNERMFSAPHPWTAYWSWRRDVEGGWMYAESHLMESLAARITGIWKYGILINSLIPGTG